MITISSYRKFRSYTIAKIIFFVIILPSCDPSQKSQTSKLNDPRFNKIDSKINEWIEIGYYPGASLLVAKDGEVIYENYFGNYTQETEVYIASAGKWLAAATIAAVVDEGKLSWDDQVKDWLPEFQDVKGEATLRQLLSHTSGYPDYQPKGKKPDYYQTLEESVENIVGLPADTIPGAKFKYGGLAMQVAGRMAEMASGMDWEQLFQEKIARPVQMENTNFTPVDSTSGHNPMIGGGARSTLHDYAHFLEMIFNDGKYEGKQVISEKSIREMQADRIGKADASDELYVQKVRGRDHSGVYGLGLWREELDGAGNAVLLSSPSWAGAYPWIDKTTNTFGFFLTHVNVDMANQAGFSSFYSSPVLPSMVRDVYKMQSIKE